MNQLSSPTNHAPDGATASRQQCDRGASATQGRAGQRLSLGLRNNNPLNIRRISGTRWKGQAAQQTDKRFVQFERIEWGLRAAFCILRTYARRYGAVCIRDIIRRWAPPAENDTAQYVRNVCLWTGFAGQQRLSEGDWPLLVKAMARQECGAHLDDVVIARGFCLYKLF